MSKPKPTIQTVVIHGPDCSRRCTKNHKKDPKFEEVAQILGGSTQFKYRIPKDSRPVITVQNSLEHRDRLSHEVLRAFSPIEFSWAAQTPAPGSNPTPAPVHDHSLNQDSRTTSRHSINIWNPIPNDGRWTPVANEWQPDDSHWATDSITLPTELNLKQEALAQGMVRGERSHSRQSTARPKTLGSNSSFREGGSILSTCFPASFEPSMMASDAYRNNLSGVDKSLFETSTSVSASRVSAVDLSEREMHVPEYGAFTPMAFQQKHDAHESHGDWGDLDTNLFDPVVAPRKPQPSLDVNTTRQVPSPLTHVGHENQTNDGVRIPSNPIEYHNKSKRRSTKNLNLSTTLVQIEEEKENPTYYTPIDEQTDPTTLANQGRPLSTLSTHMQRPTLVGDTPKKQPSLSSHTISSATNVSSRPVLVVDTPLKHQPPTLTITPAAKKVQPLQQRNMNTHPSIVRTQPPRKKVFSIDDGKVTNLTAKAKHETKADVSKGHVDEMLARFRSIRT
eukprot:m.38997 g.38997  ORF g.38997 m.38997 type:complete len:505 (+) comp18061_c0_seq1:256-1770(+)